ncbi:SRPBCC family protein [Microbacterium gorillae]|uniref:SRPBCC family protein n=1 Tax=Microbacterium gorillae TaxID=1231063 RepID=UPI0005908144|nr:SRPBCC domain-containing protein [Microbacterium gorillae]
MTESVTVQRTFAAPPERVFALFVTPEYFRTWFGTDQVELPAETFAMDARPGGAWSGVMNLPDGSTKEWVGTFHEVDAPERVVFDLTDEPTQPERLRVTVTLGPEGDGTRVSLEQGTPGWPEEAQAGLRVGYEGFFDSMQPILDRAAD